MAISLYDVSVTSSLQVLGAVTGILDRGLAFCVDNNVDPNEMVAARLVDDMQPLHFQIVSVFHHSLGAINSVKAGIATPPPPVPTGMTGRCGCRRRRRWGLWIGDDKATMVIDISSGRWRRRASAFDSGYGQRWVLTFAGGNGWQLWQRWTIETAFNGGSGGGVRWRQQRSTVLEDVGDGL